MTLKQSEQRPPQAHIKPAPQAGWRARAAAAALWMPAGAVAIAAAAASAHGLYEVALAARVPTPVAVLYPLITDGLALVAYAATTRLAARARRYAWSVVLTAAGLSGLAQAVYLADGVRSAPAVLRFGIGAWPAIAAAVVAHLVFLLATHTRAEATAVQAEVATDAVQPEVSNAAVQPRVEHPPASFNSAAPDEHGDATAGAVDERRDTDRGAAPARDRARAAARRHASLHGTLPTVSELMSVAEVARGTAAAALKDLREHPSELHIVPNERQEGTDA